MSTLQVPYRQYVKTLDSTEKVSLGTVNLARPTELAGIAPLFYIRGTLAGTEQVRINLYSDPQHATARYQSDWVALSTVTPTPMGNWLGWLVCPFARQSLAPSEATYVELETTGYTRNGDTFYLASVYSWPEATYTETGAPQVSRAFRVYGYEDLDYTL